jgi:iron complex transport system substrate-binding protein
MAKKQKNKLPELSRREFVLGAGAVMLTGMLGGCTAETITSTVTSTKTATQISTATVNNISTVTATVTSNVTKTNTITNVVTETVAGGYEVTDLMGRTVTVLSSDKILTMCGTGLEKVVILGKADNIVGSMSAASAWAQFVAPSTADVVALGNPASADVEAMLATGADLAFYWDEQGKIDDLTKNGVAVICTQVSSNNPATVDEFEDFMLSEIYLYADALGESAVAQADRWVIYVTEKLDYVAGKIATLSESDYPTVYAARTSATNCFAGGSYPNYLIQLAGGKSVTADITGLTGTVTAEQILSWDPDYIFCGRMTDTSAFTGDTTFSNLSAIKSDKVYMTPNGVMQWDSGSECILYVEYLAQILHPDLFSELDMVTEVQEYYAKFFNTELTEAQANYILSHLGPTGE